MNDEVHENGNTDTLDDLHPHLDNIAPLQKFMSRRELRASKELEVVAESENMEEYTFENSFDLDFKLDNDFMAETKVVDEEVVEENTVDDVVEDVEDNQTVIPDVNQLMEELNAAKAKLAELENGNSSTLDVNVNETNIIERAIVEAEAVEATIVNDADRVEEKKDSDRPTKKEILKTVGNTLWWTVFLGIFALIFAGILLPKFWGGQGLIVLSGSMEPYMHPGDIIAVKPVASMDEIFTNDVITFATEEEIITHRVIGFAISGGEQALIMKGDANNTQDEKPVKWEQVRGKVVYRVPKIGYASSFVQNHLLETSVTVVALLVLSEVIPFIFKKVNGKTEENNE